MQGKGFIMTLQVSAAQQGAGAMRAPGYLPVLSNLPIALRVGGLAGLGVVALLVVLGTYLAIDRQIEDGIARQEAYRALQVHQGELETASLLMRRAEKDFLLRRDVKYAEAQAKARKHALEAAEAIAAQPESRPVADKLVAVRDGVALMGKQFDEVVARAQHLGLNESQGLQGALRKAVQSAEATVNTLAGRDDMLAKMLMMRRHEKDFVMRATRSTSPTCASATTSSRRSPPRASSPPSSAASSPPTSTPICSISPPMPKPSCSRPRASRR